MKLIAFDPSLTAIGWARSPDGVEVEVGVIRPKGRGAARLWDALHRVMKKCAGYDLIVVEGYAYWATHNAHDLGELGGVLRLGWHQKKLPYVVVAPKKMKKFATGSGNAAKDAVLTEAVRRLDYQGHDNNESDALWLLQMALHGYEAPAAVELPKKHLAALQGVSWPVIDHMEF